MSADTADTLICLAQRGEAIKLRNVLAVNRAAHLAVQDLAVPLAIASANDWAETVQVLLQAKAAASETAVTQALRVAAAKGSAQALRVLLAVQAPQAWRHYGEYLPGDANHRPGDANHHLGDANHHLGDANHRPGDANHRPGDANHRPGDANHRPGDANRRPGDAYEDLRTSLLSLATLRGDKGVARALLEVNTRATYSSVLPNTYSRRAQPPLLQAAAAGNVQMTRALLAAKADVNTTHDCSETALHACVRQKTRLSKMQQGRRVCVLMLLVQSKADVDAKYDCYFDPSCTALELARRTGFWQAVGYLSRLQAMT